MKRFLSATLTLFLCTTLSYAQPLHPCAQLIWQDDFNASTLDASKWTPQLGDGCDINLCGWGNNELQYYTDRTDNIKQESGNLVITSLKENYGGRNYTSGKIRSIQKGDFTFGRIEASIKVPKGAGSWPAFWMLSTDEAYGPWPQSGEIDIMEFQGKNPNVISGTAHYGNPIPGNKYDAAVYFLPSGQNYYDNFHLFTVDWDSTSIKWYMDGNLYHTFTKDDANPYRWPFDKEFYIIFNNAVGGNLGGTVDDSSMPMTMLVDYVKVYSAATNFRIIGKQSMFTNTNNEPYYVPTIADATDYQWSVPSGASIVSGQGTSSIRVNWGGASSAGNVSLKVIRPCGAIDLVLPVKLLDDNACVLVLDDMDGNTNITYDSWNSPAFVPSQGNPDFTGNTSAKVGYFSKTNLVGTNSFVLGQVPITDYAAYESGSRILYMDIYTNADPGTTVELRFLNKLKAQGTYPAGVRTILRAKTSAFAKWETLVFQFDHNEDLTTLLSEIDQIAVVFNPEENKQDLIFYYDNIKRGLLPYNAISGDQHPPNCDILSTSYSVTDHSSSAYAWTMPSGFSITSGQSTSSLFVSWTGMPSGRIYIKETSNSCSLYTGTLDVAVTSCTGILEGQNIAALKIFPNPSRDLLTVSCDLPAATDVKLVINSTLGETLFSKNYTGQSGTFNEQLSIQELQPGSYVIQLVTSSDIRASQLIKY